MKSTDGVPTTGPRTIPSWRATSHAGPRTERACRMMARVKLSLSAEVGSKDST